jgi:hypothetical protein
MLQINEIGTVSDRIIQLVNHFCQGNKTAFGRAADIQSGVLAGFVGSRASKPGFEILQKMLTAYPTVSPDWLLFGRGEMLRQGEVVDPTSGTGSMLASSSPISPEVRQELETQLAEVNKRLDAIDEQVIQRKADEELNYMVYSVTGKPDARRPYDGLLSIRLGITKEQAIELVRSKRISSLRYGDEDDTKYWRVSELSVRDYLRAENESSANE